ncbi:MAG: glycosyltransferase family 4 protein [Candidatus Zixiibacteriota bacterium]|nr:MAG: glycosyltransferase family 4 protein [candidate division Zixibacteria bacterium]
MQYPIPTPESIPLPPLRVALVHDWLTGMRGGEKCLEVLCEFFPQAALFTLFHQKGAMSPRIEAMDIHTSWVMKLPGAKKRFRGYLPLFPAAIESFDLAEYDLVISTSHCVAKGVIPSPRALHLSYLHTPMRYIWEMYPHYLGSSRNPVKRVLGPLIASRLRTWDVVSSHRVDHFIANSENVRRRIWRHYHREAEVICPPVDAEFYRATRGPGDYFLVVTALVPYKQVRLAVEAFNRLGLKLVVVGDGPEKAKLTRLARGNVEFLGWQDPPALRELYSGCRALIFPGEEDFGIVPLEAQACGRPVIAYGRGGVLETVIPAHGAPPAAEATGLFFHQPTPEALAAAVRDLDRHAFDPQVIRRQAERFARPLYVERMARFLREKVREHFDRDLVLPPAGDRHGA